MYSIGRNDYGRLGLGENCKEQKTPTVVKGLNNVASVDAGTAVSFCVDKQGIVDGVIATF